MSSLQFKIVKTPNKNLVEFNKVYFNPSQQISNYVTLKGKSNQFVYSTGFDLNVENGFIALNSKQRDDNNKKIDDLIECQPYNKTMRQIEEIFFVVDSKFKIDVDCNQITDKIKMNLINQPFSLKQSCSCVYNDIDITLTVKSMDFIDKTDIDTINNATDNVTNNMTDDMADDIPDNTVGLLTNETTIYYISNKPSIELRNQTNQMLFKNGMTLNDLNIGGMDEELNEIFVKAFVSRARPDIAQKMGIKHTKGILLYGPPGCGKCLGKNTPVLMFDGSIKMVQDIEIGDKLMGDDNTERIVISLARGKEQLYKVHQKFGNDYVINESHILSLAYDSPDLDVCDIELTKYLNLSADIKNLLRGYKVSIDFEKKSTQFDAYSTGVLLAKKFINNTIHSDVKESDTIPQEYKINDVNTRLELLKGIVENGGSYIDNYFTINTKNKKFHDDILFICRSLGIQCVTSVYQIDPIDQIERRDYVIKINSKTENFCDAVMKNKIVTEIFIEKLEVDDYYGFEITGNRRFLLGDFTVTHNTLLARQMGKLLNCVGPKIIRGPELLNKYYGQSEENVRNLFREAINDKSDNLHLIICDEFDALCGKRSLGNNNLNDSIVNQLLSMIDGPDELHNILMICMTNRKDMIDEAMLRSGRLQLAIEIKLPDEKGRLDILKIHTKLMKSNGYLNDEISLEEIAKNTENYTGAELKQVVDTVSSFGLSRTINIDDGKISTKKENINITRDDFVRAINQVTPMFGRASVDIQNINSIPFVFWTNHLVEIHNDIIRKISSLNFGKLSSILIKGKSGIGKTKFVANLTKSTEVSCVKIINSEKLLRSQNKKDYVIKTFEECSKTSNSILILDGFERIIEWFRVNTSFNSDVFQTCVSILENPIKQTKKMTIICTANDDLCFRNETTTLKVLGIYDLFDSVYSFPDEIKYDEIKKSFQEYYEKNGLENNGGDGHDENDQKYEKYEDVSKIFKSMKYY